MAKIERNIERKIKVAKQRQISNALMEDVDELTELLKTNFIPVAEHIEWNFEELRDMFPSQQLSLDYKLGHAIGGFRSIAIACDDNLTDAKVEQLLQKRQKSMEAVGLALDSVENAVKILKFNHLGGRIKNWAKADGYESADVSFKDGKLVARKWQTYRGEYGFWESTLELRPVEMPDCSRVRSIIDHGLQKKEHPPAN
ncbi:MAG: hypothetical protein AAGA12_11785 [Pseudomonadota bacterium]